VAGDEDQRERRFCRLYEANFRPVQAYAVNRLARPDDVADVVAEASGVVNSIGGVPSAAT
jgi:DNA-directed RNA polymerase specialized sigma24 family protein